MKLIVGLGNPGKQYANTRHNVGFMVLDKIRADFDFSKFENSKKILGETSKGMIEREKIVLLKPETFMNDSGAAVAAAITFYKIPPDEIIVIHDDKDIPLGETRVQTDRGAAGHNGVRSIIERIGTQNFTRIRVGIAPDKKIADTANFVLEKFTNEERNELKNIFKNVIGELISFCIK